MEKMIHEYCTMLERVGENPNNTKRIDAESYKNGVIKYN